MFRKLRAWWTSQSAPYGSPEHDAAMEVLRPGYLNAKAEAQRRDEERRRGEQAWFDRLLALQEAGRIEEAIERAEAELRSGATPFVGDPLEKYALAYAREVDRLLAAGDVAGARAAASEAVRHLQIWASGATSGGEGTARLREAGEMEAELRRRIVDAIPDGSISPD